jgi:DNA-binding beta-propeller fold protein YncE
MIKYSGEFRLKNQENLSPPSGMAMDNKGNFIVADEFNHRIQKYDTHGNLINFFGRRGGGEGEFYYPKGIAIDSEGCLYVADCWNHRIQKLSPVSHESGSWKFMASFGSYGDDAGKFNEPYDIAIDKRGRIFVLDRCNHRVQVFGSKGNHRGIIGQRGTVIEEELAELFDTPLNLFSFPAFEFPTGINVDSFGNIYVVDSNNHRIVKLTPEGDVSLSFGKNGSGDGEFQYPHGIAIDNRDTIFVSDLNNNRIQAFTPYGNLLFSINTGRDISDKLSSPTSLLIDNHGRLYTGLGFDTRILIFEYEMKEMKQWYGGLISTNNKPQVMLGLARLHSENRLPEMVLYEDMISSNLEEMDDREFIELIGGYIYSLSKHISDKDHEFEELRIDFKKIDNILTMFNTKIKKIEDEIIKIKEERIGFSEDYTSRIINRENNILNPPKDEFDEIGFDETLYSLEKKDRSLNRCVRHKLLTRKRLITKKVSLVEIMNNLAQEKGGFIEDIENLIKDSLSLSLRESRLLLNLLEERKGYEIEAEGFFRDESRGDEENWRGFKKYLQRSDIIQDILPHIFFSLNLSITNINRLLKSVIQFQSSALNPLKQSMKRVQDKVQGQGLPFSLQLSNEGYIFAKIILYSSSIWEHILPLEENIKEFIGIAADPSFIKDAVKEPLPLSTSSVALTFDDLINSIFVEGRVVVSSKIDPPIAGKPHLSVQQACDAIESIKAQLKKLLLDRDRIGEEIIKVDNSLARIPVREEKMRIPLLNNKLLWNVHDKLNQSHIGELFIINQILSSTLFQLGITTLSDEKISELTEFYETQIVLSSKLRKEGHEEEERFKAELDSIIFSINSDKGREIELKNMIFKTSRRTQFANTYSKRIRGSLTLLRQNSWVVKTQNSRPKFDMSFGNYGKMNGEFNSPGYIISDRKGDIYVADMQNNRIQKFDRDGKYILSFGGFGSIEGRFKMPVGIALDRDGNLLVSDWLNHRIQRFSPQGTFISCFGRYGSKDGEFNKPAGFAVDKDGFIYIADSGNKRVQKFNQDDKFIASFGTDIFKEPYAICISSSKQDRDDRNIYVGELAGNRIFVFNSDGSLIKSEGGEGTENGKFQWIGTITDDKKENLYVADFWNSRIQVFSKDLKFVSSFGKYGRGEGEFDGVSSIMIIDEFLFVCDFFNHRIQRFRFNLKNV